MVILLMGINCLGLENMLRNCPDFQIENYKTDPYLNAVIQFQEMGEECAIENLRYLAKNQDNDRKIIVLTRMLLKKKQESEYRRPLIGNAAFFGGTGYIDWPMEPIEIKGGIPFLIVKGYTVGGRPELASSYLEYCIKNYLWTSKRYKIKSFVEKQVALKALIVSPKWKNKLLEKEKNWFSAQITN